MFSVRIYQRIVRFHIRIFPLFQLDGYLLFDSSNKIFESFLKPCQNILQIFYKKFGNILQSFSQPTNLYYIFKASIFINRKLNISQNISDMYGLSVNKYMHIVNGNRGHNYKIAMWNCRRGLVDLNGLPSEKFTEILHFVQLRQPHLFCIVEFDWL